MEREKQQKTIMEWKYGTSLTVLFLMVALIIATAAKAESIMLGIGLFIVGLVLMNHWIETNYKKHHYIATQLYEIAKESESDDQIKLSLKDFGVRLASQTEDVYFSTLTHLCVGGIVTLSTSSGENEEFDTNIRIIERHPFSHVFKREKDDKRLTADDVFITLHKKSLDMLSVVYGIGIE